MPKPEYSFKRGISQVKVKDLGAVRTEIMSALGITSRMGYNQRLNGKIEPRVSEAEAIEKIFAKYGIKDVWGEV